MVDVRLRVLRNKVLQIAVVFLLALFSVGQLFIYLHCYLKAGRTVIHHHRELYSNVRHHGILPTTNNTEYTVTLPPGCKDAYYHNNISDQKFVLALNYWEQLTMATASLYDLVEFAKEWNARTVEPFTLLAEFWGLPSTVNFPTFPSMPHIYSQSNTYKLNNIFNMSVLNSDILCGKFNYPPLASFDEFINAAHRDVIILHLIFDDHSIRIPEMNTAKCIECLHFKKIKIFSVKLQHYLNQISDKHDKPKFRIKDAFCFNHLHITTPKEIAKLCGFHENNNISIIITVWRGYSDIPTKTYRLIVPKHALEQRPSLFSSGGLYALNDDVLSNSSAYLRKISHGKPFIAVHFRTEKIEKLSPASANFCLNRTFNFISQIKKKYKDIDVKYFVDYGEYGSHSHEALFGRKISRQFFANEQITPLHYNPIEFGGLADQGFVALVELSTIARAKVLILVGGGSFQDQILMNFKRNQNAAVAYKICWTSKQEILEIKVPRHH